MPNDSEISRREILAGIGVSLAILGQSFAAEPSAPTVVEPAVLTRADIDRMMVELSNWGRWGKDDQMGTVNLITAPKRRHALSLAREGTVVSLSHAQSTELSLDNKFPLVRDTFSYAGLPGRRPENSRTSADTYTMTYHGFYFSHMDALCHMFWNGKSYNGYQQDTVSSSAGASRLDIAAFKNGIVTRGVLMDIPRVKGVPYLEPGFPIYPADLDAAEKMANVKVATGDMLMLRTGRWARRAEKGPWATGTVSAGLHATSVRWLKERDIAVLASNSISDVYPSRVEDVPDPIHRLVIVALGTPIFDNLDFEELSATASRLKRWEFLLTTAPMVIPGGTGSPLNPLAIF